MTAHSVVRKVADPDQQRLLDSCKNKRWTLLQSFAALEIAVDERQDKAIKTFGAKLRAQIKLDSQFKKFEPLIATRNLIAHALVAVAKIDGNWCAIWHMADGECNAAVMSDRSLEKWFRTTSSLLNDALAKVRAYAVRAATAAAVHLSCY